MNINNVTTASNGTAVSPIQEQTTTRDSVQARQSAAEQTAAANKAVLVALKSLMSTELDALARTIATRTTLMNKLPPEFKELVQKILNQTQAAQTALPAGLAALLASSRSAGEKLGLLAAMLEEAAGADTAKTAEQADGKNAGKQQVPEKFMNALRDSNPDELKAAAKMLKELATAANQAGKQAAQELPAKPSQPGQAATRQQEPPTTPQPGQAAGKQPDTPTPQAGRLPVMQQGAAMPRPAGAPAEPPAAPVPASQPAEEPDAPLARPNNSANQPENRPATQPAIPQKPNSMAAENKNPAAALPAADTPEANSVMKQQQAPGAAARSGGGMPEQPEAAVLARMLAARPEIMKNMPAEIKEFIQVLLKQTDANKPVTTNLPEPLATLLKSPQPAADKFTMLARLLAEAAGSFRQDGGSALQTAVGGQQVLAELINAWRNKNQEVLRAAAKAMRELADTMPKPGVLAERQAGHSVLSFTVPLYFGDGQSVYPAHIHIYYQEEEDKKKSGQQMTETWLRICLETENIGMVEAAFRLYDGQNLDVKVRFDDSEAADSFVDSVPAVKEQLGQLPFQLGEFLVR
ncbi:hypothetical protein [Sporomusa sphaeroides]|uniref:hypothetical protein n=1 Tax=Sporomusa sphaeroides TaxID=47679 RepID=UPI002BCB6DE6|nr:hypothetical protein [Sporomusa sphaeroides]HML34046.1 hypothetical protein [Sporomusa sphaeroides]